MACISTCPAFRIEAKFVPASGDQVQAAGFAGRDLKAFHEVPTFFGLPSLPWVPVRVERSRRYQHQG